jgi:hypothetical protein
MLWLRRLLASRASKQLALEILDRVLEEAEDVIDITRRLQRDADTKDLENSLGLYVQLRRRAQERAG